MSEWELMTRVRKSRGFGHDWNDVPCVAISKNGFRFNSKFMHLYIGSRKSVEVFLRSGYVGFKVVPLGEIRPHSYPLIQKGNSDTCSIKCPSIMQRLDGYYGTAFKVTRAELIISVSLDLDNMCE